jgi:hypothetical protein
VPRSIQCQPRILCQISARRSDPKPCQDQGERGWDARAAGRLGLRCRGPARASTERLERTYGHHHPDHLKDARDTCSTVIPRNLADCQISAPPCISQVAAVWRKVWGVTSFMPQSCALRLKALSTS